MYLLLDFGLIVLYAAGVACGWILRGLWMKAASLHKRV